MYGQMNEPPGARARVGLTALTLAEYFRDSEGQDVLLFIDNIFRFTQANSEVLYRFPPLFSCLHASHAVCSTFRAFRSTCDIALLSCTYCDLGTYFLSPCVGVLWTLVRVDQLCAPELVTSCVCVCVCAFFCCFAQFLY